MAEHRGAPNCSLWPSCPLMDYDKWAEHTGQNKFRILRLNKYHADAGRTNSQYKPQIDHRPKIWRFTVVKPTEFSSYRILCKQWTVAPTGPQHGIRRWIISCNRLCNSRAPFTLGLGARLIKINALELHLIGGLNWETATVKAASDQW